MDISHRNKQTLYKSCKYNPQWVANCYMNLIIKARLLRRAYIHNIPRLFLKRSESTLL